MARDLFFSAPVVQLSLFSPAHTTHSLSTIEECDGLIMLAFSILDHQFVLRVIGIDRQLRSGVASKPIELRLPYGRFTK